jgi:small subunit ribosomal protein S2
MLTNFSTIGERIKKLKKLENDKQEGKLDVRTKKEMIKIDMEINKLNLNLSGIREMKDLPKAVFVVDMPREIIAIREARILSIPIIAMADSNSEVSLADYPIPANDDAIRSIRLIVETIGKAIYDGKQIYDAKTDKEAKEDSLG